MSVNRELLLEVLEIIRVNPEQWNQEDWHTTPEERGAWSHCGTAHCFAGWAKLIFLELPTNDPDIFLERYANVEWPDGLAEFIIYESNKTPMTSEELRETYSVRTLTSFIARFALGITDDQADRLFNANNSFEQLERIVYEILEEDTQKQLQNASDWGKYQYQIDVNNSWKKGTANV